MEKQKAECEGQLRVVVDCLKEMEGEKRSYEDEKRAKERAHVEKMVCGLSICIQQNMVFSHCVCVCV